MHALSNLLMVQADPISKRYVNVKQYLASAEGSARQAIYVCMHACMCIQSKSAGVFNKPFVVYSKMLD